MEAHSCAHCGSVIAILSRAKEKIVISGMDLAKAVNHNQELNAEYRGKWRCNRCRKNICRQCARRLTITHRCEPIRQKVDDFLKRCGR